MTSHEAEEESAAAPKAVPRVLRLAGCRPVGFPAIMGVVNVTPDSFSDGGLYFDHARAVERALEMIAEGAQIVDIGGESTRPGARGISAEIELERVVPVIGELSRRVDVPLSVDTRKAEVAAAALAAGASIVNDVSAMSFDPAMAATIARANGAVVLMHMRGTPEIMMSLAEYGSVVDEVCDYLRQRAEAACQAGISPERIFLDPGIGFAKNPEHNLAILTALPRLRELGHPVLVGVSRKSFLRHFAGEDDEEIRFATAAAVAAAILHGASVVRVHDPKPMAAVLKISNAIRAAAR